MFGCNNDNLSPEKDTVKDHISNTKLEKAFSSLVLEIWCFTVSLMNEFGSSNTFYNPCALDG